VHDPSTLLDQWGYAGIFLAVVPGNVGVPVPEETVLALEAIERYGRWAFVTSARLQKISELLIRYGAFAIFAARFVTGVRFLAGSLAGTAGVPPLTFTIANVLGALAYVPYAVGIGYGVAGASAT
jgi:membrane protein DedA with SNARE-associated domain